MAVVVHDLSVPRVRLVRRVGSVAAVAGRVRRVVDLLGLSWCACWDDVGESSRIVVTRGESRSDEARMSVMMRVMIVRAVWAGPWSVVTQDRHGTGHVAMWVD